ncbi:oxidative damage protection protein [Buchnera aphidicola (Acyrthosiphon lactucae)]|uniref:Probable Fe(2+)-trafficking protein n=1 Tax=Buchnera aphidicola (Acyrthosiphon lactucae) TaxID=1241832 RepID=A0A4D6XMF5_9GAMM|nr:oxidative damage protection protein [Buchnera aphidicola]QCI17926.1 oxidative damage protection protein [Buchnera aphidicola (Acyrthosiphon lactucae)]
MNRIIFCTFFKKKMEGQDFQSYPGKLGEKIYDQISKKAWQKWLIKQTILINENNLNMLVFKDRKKIEEHMEKFLFKK